MLGLDPKGAGFRDWNQSVRAQVQRARTSSEITSTLVFRTITDGRGELCEEAKNDNDSVKNTENHSPLDLGVCSDRCVQ